MYGFELRDFEKDKAPKYFYRGDAGAEARDMQRAQEMGGYAAGRAAPLANYAQADAARQNALAARGDQAGAVALYRNAAMGNGPSAAQSQFQQGLDASLRAQQSIAAGARGGAMARSAARSEAAANAGDMSARASSLAAQLRAQEMQAAMQGYAGSAAQLRGTDLAAQGQEAQQAQFQAGQQLQSRALNDQAQMGYETMAQRTAGMGMQGRTNAEERYQTNEQNDVQRDQDMREKSADRNVRVGMGVASGLTSMMGGMSDARQKRDVKGGDAPVRGFLDALAAHEYRYKDPGKDGAGPHVSPMAQELEKAGPVGRSMVEETPRGKMVDYAKGFGAMLAAQASLNKRLEHLEGAFTKRKAA